MPEYLSPGVYVEEVDRGTRPIEGVGTACAAFVGFAPSGPANRPILITSWTQYVDTFGRLEGARKIVHIPNGYLAHAVYGYFENGGGRCYVTRIDLPEFSTAIPDKQSLKAASSSDQVAFELKPRVASDQKITVNIAKASAENNGGTPEPTPPPTDENPGGRKPSRPANASSSMFRMTISVGENVADELDNLTLTQVKDSLATNSLLELIIPEGRELAMPALNQTITFDAPTRAKSDLPSAITKELAVDFRGASADRTGVLGFEVCEDVTMVCCPDLMAVYNTSLTSNQKTEFVKSVQSAMVSHCQGMGDRVAILDTPPNLKPQDALTWRMLTNNIDSKYAALYYPWIDVTGPDGQKVSVPPCGHVAGVYARNDRERGVHKAPANEVVLGAISLEMQLTKGEQDTLNPNGVNCIRTFPGRGIRIWGARTLSSDPAWRYVNVRRIFNYVAKSIENGTQWVVFEPNDEDLWARVKRDVTAFLLGVWRDGMLFGSTPSQAFYVKCDEELNPVDVRDRGQLIIEIGLAPVKPAEFVIFRISQWAGGGS